MAHFACAKAPFVRWELKQWNWKAECLHASISHLPASGSQIFRSNKSDFSPRFPRYTDSPKLCMCVCACSGLDFSKIPTIFRATWSTTWCSRFLLALKMIFYSRRVLKFPWTSSNLCLQMIRSRNWIAVLQFSRRVFADARENEFNIVGRE